MEYNIYADEKFRDWDRTVKRQFIPVESFQEVDESLRDSIIEELEYLKSLDVTEYSLHHKYLELQDWFPSQNLDVTHEVKDLIWKPKGRGDFRYIEPELVFIKNSVGNPP